MIRNNILIYAAITAVLVPGLRAQTCYYPSTKNATDLRPCDTSKEHSHCCGVDALCLDNGLCLGQSDEYSNRISRAGCTDPTFQDESCPQYCIDVNLDLGCSIFLGPETPTGTFCCVSVYDTEAQECSVATKQSKVPFDIPPGRVLFDRVGANTTNDNALGLSATLANVTTTVTTTATPSSKSSTSNDVAIGAGIGVPLGVMLLTAIGLLVHQQRHKKNLQKQLVALQEDKNRLISNGNSITPYSYLGAGALHMQQPGHTFLNQELYNDNQIVELQNQRDPFELDTRLRSPR